LELACPELLTHDDKTVLQIVYTLLAKEVIIDKLLQRSKQPPQSPRKGVLEELASLVAQITKMDLDRTRFMLIDLARTRMAKIENHALHNRTLIDRMTKEEVRVHKILHRNPFEDFFLAVEKSNKLPLTQRSHLRPSAVWGTPRKALSTDGTRPPT
jgi:hypothetical protein